MIKYKAIIVDDELYARENLKDLLNEFCPEIEIVAEANSTSTAEAAIMSIEFDILFLDINLGNENSFALLHKLSADKSFTKNFTLIFITAYDEYALKAFQVNAVDYLLKPVSAELLLESMNKIKRLFRQEENSNLLSIISNNSVKKIITVPYKDAWEIVATDDILYIEAERAYSRIHTLQDKKMYASKSLREYELALSSLKYMIRVHKSFIVNVNHIARIIKSGGGYLELTNNKQIPISNTHKKDIYEYFK